MGYGISAVSFVKALAKRMISHREALQNLAKILSYLVCYASPGCDSGFTSPNVIIMANKFYALPFCRQMYDEFGNLAVMLYAESNEENDL
jgi:hypothetical protein